MNETSTPPDAQHSSALTGKLLIAMPGIGDPRFEHSVILICEHSGEGTMGLIINKPAQDVQLSDVCSQLGLGEPDAQASPTVHFGGPVDMGRGFVLHSDDYASGQGGHIVIKGLRLSATLDVLEDIAAGCGPRQAILALGYAGWGAGQLEDEIRANGWLTAQADPAFVLNGEDGDKWTAALRELGVDPLLLSAEAGRA